jgi:predicted dehydrogenase
MPARPIGVLLVAGNFTHQETYARAFAADPRCRLVGLTDERDVPDERARRNAALAGELGLPVLDDLDAALRRDDVDVVSVLAEPERRGPIAAAAARAGRHVYLDKEPAVTRAGLREVTAAVRATGVLSQSFSLVRSPLSQQARRTVQSGRLGPLRALHMEMFFAKGIPTGTPDPAPRRERAVAGQFTFPDAKRELLCVGWYPLILFQWLTGRRVKSVSATTSNHFFAEHRARDVEDFAAVLLELEDGTTGSLLVGRTGWTSHPSHGLQRLRLVGAKGIETLDAYRPRWEFHTADSAWHAPASPHPEDPMGFWASTQAAGGVTPKLAWHPVAETARSDMAAFLDCVASHRPSDVDADLAAHTVATVLACYESAAEQKSVAVRPVDDASEE